MGRPKIMGVEPRPKGRGLGEWVGPELLGGAKSVPADLGREAGPE